MSSIRDLLVSIDFEGVNINELLHVDSAMDAIEDQLVSMGHSIDATTDIINDLGDDGGDAMDALEDGAIDAEDAAEDLEHQLGQTDKATGSLGGSIKKLIGVVAGLVALDKIKDLGISMVESAASAAATEAQFEQVFGNLEGQAEQSLKRVADETQVLSTRLKGSFLGMAAFAKTTGMETADSLNLAERATLAAADSAAFYDRSIEDVSESLTSFLKGNYANDAALGISATETTRNATANKLYKKSFKDLSEAQKQLTLLQMVEDGNKLSGALGQAAREGDGFENVVGNLKQSWIDLKAKIGAKLLGPVVTEMQGMTGALMEFDPEPVINFVEKIVKYGVLAKDILLAVKESIMSLYYDTGEVADIWTALGVPEDIAEDIAFIGEVLKTVVVEGIDVAKGAFDLLLGTIDWAIDNFDLVKAGAIGFVTALGAFKIITGINTAMGVMNTLLAAYRTGTLAGTLAQYGLNTAMLASPLTWIVVGIGAVVAAGVLLYQNWDTVKEKAGLLWDKTKEVFGKFKDYITEKLEPVKNFFDKLGQSWDRFKESISNFKMPKIGLPKFLGGDGFIQGSHASGLASVPNDGYVAELHKNEAVLTAKQSDALRAAGILTNSGDKPKINFNDGGGRGNGGPGATYAPQYQIIIQGGEDSKETAEKVRAVVKEENERFWRQMAMKLA